LLVWRRRDAASMLGRRNKEERYANENDGCLRDIIRRRLATESAIAEDAISKPAAKKSEIVPSLIVLNSKGDA
jgi:hypothetical protein